MRLTFFLLSGRTDLIQDIKSFSWVRIIQEFGHLVSSRRESALHKELDQSDISFIEIFDGETFGVFFHQVLKFNL